MIHITCRLTAKNRDQLWNPMLGNRVWAIFYVETVYSGLSIKENFNVQYGDRTRQDNVWA